MGRYTKEDVIRIVTKCAVQYRTYLLDFSLINFPDEYAYLKKLIRWKVLRCY